MPEVETRLFFVLPIQAITTLSEAPIGRTTLLASVNEVMEWTQYYGMEPHRNPYT